MLYLGVATVFMSPLQINSKIQRLISALPNKRSSGHDNIDNVLLKKIEVELAPMLANIFNQSLSTGVFPDVMKIG